MSADQQHTCITIPVQLTNPGEFFACCGMLELASRALTDAKARFTADQNGTSFELSFAELDGESSLIDLIASCSVESSLSNQQLARLRVVLNQKKEQRSKDDNRLKQAWEKTERITLHSPFDLTINWWLGDTSLKTWAGKQLVMDILAGLLPVFKEAKLDRSSLVSVLAKSANTGALPFYFDARIGGHSSSLDVGFSLNKHEMRSRIRPAVEFLAFIGLQRFRPRRNGSSFEYHAWTSFLDPMLASAVVGGTQGVSKSSCYEFPLLFRTEYLKSFLSAKLKPTPDNKP